MATSKQSGCLQIDCTILFADIAGSTRLYHRLGDVLAEETISRSQQRMAAVVRRHGGVVVKEIGDETMSRFPTADQAVAAACDLQKAFAEDQAAFPQPVKIRIGLHHGLAILRGGDLFGNAVNVAARMRDIARGGEIITTEETVHRLAPSLAQRARQFDRTLLKGKDDPVSIYDVVWERQDSVTSIAMEGGAAVGAVDRATLYLRHGTQEWTMTTERTAISLGRDPHCDVVLDGDYVSRTHARIRFQRGKFLLEDCSTNGTHVRTNDGNVVFLRREKLPLWGRGVISLGRPLVEPVTQLVHFRCEG
ncbi:MAG: adenylate/guanylate cyclase domain-containing protein [Nitrospirota bacterium]|jgi:class 3 adenylate cyclase